MGTDYIPLLHKQIIVKKNFTTIIMGQKIYPLTFFGFFPTFVTCKAADSFSPLCGNNQNAAGHPVTGLSGHSKLFICCELIKTRQVKFFFFSFFLIFILFYF